MTELALTRIFSVVMYYHFAFLAISIALFGLSASGVYAYLRRRALERHETEALLARQALVYAASTIVALFALVRLRVGRIRDAHVSGEGWQHEDFADREGVGNHVDGRQERRRSTRRAAAPIAEWPARGS